VTKPYLDLYTYADDLAVAIHNIDEFDLDRIVDIIIQAMGASKTIFTCGNGGSAAISEHLSCDCMKGVATDTELYPKIISLASNVSVMTAIANDIGYDEVFSKQIEWQGRRNDVLIAISSSGNSPNICKALQTAKAKCMKTIAIVGFDGGAALDYSDVYLHIESNNYGIVEDASQALMHFIAQTIRRTQSDKNPEEIKY